jgi:hypothetical protein
MLFNLNLILQADQMIAKQKDFLRPNRQDFYKS